MADVRDDTITEYRYVSTCYLCDGWGVIPTPPAKYPSPQDFACNCPEGLKVQERRAKQGIFYSNLRLAQ